MQPISARAIEVSPTLNETEQPGVRRYQFSLRAMFVVLTLAAIGLAVMPKDERAIPWLFNRPQFALAAWAIFRGLRPVAGQPRKDTQLSFGFYGVSLAIGLILPTIVSLLMLDWVKVNHEAVLVSTMFTIFSLLALEPLCVVVGLCGPVRGATASAHQSSFPVRTSARKSSFQPAICILPRILSFLG